MKKSILFAGIILLVLGSSLFMKKASNIEEENIVTKSSAEDILATMTLEEKVGQMFLVRFPETDVVAEIKDENPGGYILFARDFENETPETILSKLKECQDASKINLFFGVDEEGGTVTRISRYAAFRSSKFKSPRSIFEEGGFEKIIEDVHEKDLLIKSLGLNMNLTPVVDIPTNSESFMYDRAFSTNAEETSKFAKDTIKQMNEDKIISCMKHFPGYGDNVDTHTGVAVDERSIKDFENSDFLPFEAGINEGCPMILVNHNIINSMDEEYPASLSKEVHKSLRENLNFDGIIITDDLAMDAVKEYAENGKAAVQAVLSGNDMIISSDFRTQKQEVLNAIKDGTISEDLINEAVLRILKCKEKYEISNKE